MRFQQNWKSMGWENINILKNERSFVIKNKLHIIKLNIKRTIKRNKSNNENVVTKGLEVNSKPFLYD